MIEESGFLISGIVLGLAAGISPGPLLALVFSETLKYGKKEGMKIAIAPLITDPPIILFVFLILFNAAGYNFVIGAIALFGAGYLAYLGILNLRAKSGVSEIPPAKRDALRQGITVNFLNPHPYLFWITIGGPIIFEALDIGIPAVIFFILGFYSLLVGSKIAVALLVEKSKSFFGSRYYLSLLRVLGMILILFALILLRDGLNLIGIF